MRAILCWLGFHKWDSWSRCFGGYLDTRTCLHCGQPQWRGRDES